MPTASWNQLERTIEQLHAAARTAIGVREFYRLLVAEAIAALEAAGGAAWRRGSGGRPELICQTLPDNGVEADWSARFELVERTLASRSATIVAYHGDHDLLVCPVDQPAGADAANELAHSLDSAPVAALELWMPHGASPPVRQGWLDFASALADVAADFHAREELRRLRGASVLRGQAVELIRRVSAPQTLAGAAFEVANEGRRLLNCDRVAVLVRRGNRWRLIAVSGVDAVARGVDFARRSEQLADQTARWGEPLNYPTLAETDELPPRLADAIEQHIDHSHARALAAAPIRFPSTDGESTAKFDVVLLAERFDAGAALCEPLLELGELTAPALARAAQLDRFPLRTVLRWSERIARLRQPSRLARVVLFAALAAGGIAALLLLPADFTIEAPAHLAAAVERDVFATATGSVAEVRVTHGQQVAAGEVLIVLNDPELSLQQQATRGEIEAARKRLDALAVTRTDRSLRDEPTGDRLPLAAEQRELEERLASLRRELELLDARHEALTIRSPRAGQVLTRDVQTLLESRPVERGQALLTIADASAGWELRADVPQSDIGHVLAARDAAQSAPVGVTYRLAGDVEATHPGHLIEVAAAAPLDPAGLRDEAAPVEVRIAVDGTPPAAVRPGMNATVRIDCGQRSLGYVWLHDAAATIYRWATF